MHSILINYILDPNTQLMKKYVKSLKKNFKNKDNFANINCGIKLTRFETVHLRLLTDIFIMRPLI